MQTPWIIQVNPAELDLQHWAQRMRSGQAERDGEWRIHRYMQQLKPGQPVLFWQSGKRAGIYLRGEVISSAYRHPDTEEAPWHIGYRVSHEVKPPLLRTELKQHPLLHQLQVLKRPQGNLFSCSPSEAEVLWHLLRSRQQALPSQQALSFPRVLKQIQRRGLQISERFLRRYHLALESASLVILSGTSGVGKSWLTSAYASAVGARYLLAPVAPNWANPEDLLGYFNPVHQRFQPSAVLLFIQDAAAHWQQSLNQAQAARPYHLVLDELNLARVEYYLAPLLSALEVRRRGESASLQLPDGPVVTLSPNLALIGTLNMDESTYPLSDKVCDRAQILEWHSELEALRARWGDSPWETWWKDHLESLLALVPFAHRTQEDVQHYVQAAEALGVSAWQALDEALMQKYLPRIRHLQLHQRDALKAVQAILPEACSLSHAKLQSLDKQILEQGFASYFG